jgi:hypothetical protein
MTEHGFHEPRRLPPSRLENELVRLGPYGPLRNIDALRDVPVGMSLAGLTLVVFTAESFADRHRSMASAAFQ